MLTQTTATGQSANRPVAKLITTEVHAMIDSRFRGCKRRLPAGISFWGKVRRIADLCTWRSRCPRSPYWRWTEGSLGRELCR